MCIDELRLRDCSIQWVLRPRTWKARFLHFWFVQSMIKLSHVEFYCRWSESYIEFEIKHDVTMREISVAGRLTPSPSPSYLLLFSDRQTDRDRQTGSRVDMMHEVGDTNALGMEEICWVMFSFVVKQNVTEVANLIRCCSRAVWVVI